MKPNDIYLGKPEGVALWSDYPIKIKLIRQIVGSHYANKGDWEAVSYYFPKWAKTYHLEQAQELVQIWTEEQIRATFQVEDLV